MFLFLGIFGSDVGRVWEVVFEKQREKVGGGGAPFWGVVAGREREKVVSVFVIYFFS